MMGDWKLSDQAPIRERAPLEEQCVAFETSQTNRKEVLTEKRDNMNRVHKPRLWEHKAKRTQANNSEMEAPYHEDDITLSSC